MQTLSHVLPSFLLKQKLPMENLIRVTFVRVELPLHLNYTAFKTEVGRCASECRIPSSFPKKYSKVKSDLTPLLHFS